MINIEKWKDIEGYENQYQVSNFGNVRRLAYIAESDKNYKRRMEAGEVKIRDNGNGYSQINIWRKNKRKVFLVHRLVAKSFIENPKKKPQVNHINGVKADNSAINLEWATSSENIRHAWENNLFDREKRRVISTIASKNRAKPIYCLHIETGLYFKFKAIWEASEIGFDRICIHSVNVGNNYTYRGMIWDRDFNNLNIKLLAYKNRMAELKKVRSEKAVLRNKKYGHF